MPGASWERGRNSGFPSGGSLRLVTCGDSPRPVPKRTFLSRNQDKTRFSSYQPTVYLLFAQFAVFLLSGEFPKSLWVPAKVSYKFLFGHSCNLGAISYWYTIFGIIFNVTEHLAHWFASSWLIFVSDRTSFGMFCLNAIVFSVLFSISFFILLYHLSIQKFNKNWLFRQHVWYDRSIEITGQIINMGKIK